MYTRLCSPVPRSRLVSQMPDNAPVKKMAQGFKTAWQLYGAPEAIVLFIVLDVEINIADQRHLEYEIMATDDRIAIQRCTLVELYERGQLRDDKTLI
jgi:hypothetical protein